MTNIYEVLEQTLGRTLSSIEYEKINKWLENYNEEVIKYAIELSVNSNIVTFNYIEGIVKNWKSNKYNSLEQIKKANEKREEEKIVPNWLDKDIKKQELTKEEQEEIDKLFSEFKGDE